MNDLTADDMLFQILEIACELKNAGYARRAIALRDTLLKAETNFDNLYEEAHLDWADTKGPYKKEDRA